MRFSGPFLGEGAGARHRRNSAAAALCAALLAVHACSTTTNSSSTVIASIHTQAWSRDHTCGRARNLNTTPPKTPLFPNFPIYSQRTYCCTDRLILSFNLHHLRVGGCNCSCDAINTTPWHRARGSLPIASLSVGALPWLAPLRNSPNGAPAAERRDTTQHNKALSLHDRDLLQGQLVSSIESLIH